MQILPPALFLLSSYFHAFKRSYIALGFILIWGGLVIILTFMSVLIGSAFEGHPWIGASPGLVAFTTILLALINTIIYLNNKPKLAELSGR